MPEFPKRGCERTALFAEMEAARRNDVDWRRGRLGLYVHFAGDDVLEVAKDAYRMFFSENALGPAAFPSLRKFEEELVGWSLDLLHAGSGGAGNVTSGGTESIFLALKAARDWARAERGIATKAEVVAPISAHPAFNKAAHYLDMKVTRVPLGADFRADAKAMEAAITPSTVMMIGSAPAFPHGVIDPIASLAAVAARRGLWFHVDACVGGFLAPFVRKLGRKLPEFDFAVPGVTTISADLHKYGFAGKGASTILYRDAAMRKHQVFEFDEWPRGKYAAPTFAGSRPGGAIASAWAVMRYLGEDGYVRLADVIMTTRDRFMAGIRAIDGLCVWGEPDLSIIGYGATAFDIFAVADALAKDGWFVSRGSQPPCIHLGMLTPAHAPIVDEYLASLARAVAEVRARGAVSASRDVSYGG